MIPIPKKIKTFLIQLNENGHTAYLVGGAVRDMLMNIEPKDWDIATSANPGQIKDTFAYIADVKQIDASFPVVVVDGVEIATYRKDIYKDGETIGTVPVLGINLDLGRRDLTINAMAMGHEGRIIDPYEGRFDLENRRIRFVGNATERIDEDPCRVIRACRFLAAIDGYFTLETWAALINDSKFGNNTVPPERIRLEILKAMKYKNASKFFNALHDIELLDKIFPSLEKTWGRDHGQYHDENIFDHMMYAGDAIPASNSKVEAELTDEEQVLLRLTGYLHDVGKSQPNYKIGEKGEDDEIHFYEHEHIGYDLLKVELKALTFSTSEIKYITNLVRVHMRGSSQMSPKSTRKVIKLFADLDVNWQHWLILKAADRTANTKKVDQPLRVVKIAKKFLHELEGIPHEKGPRDPNGPAPCFEHKQLAISGTNIQALLGIGPSQMIGVILQYLLDRVISDPSLNTREQLEILIVGKKKK